MGGIKPYQPIDVSFEYFSGMTPTSQGLRITFTELGITKDQIVAITAVVDDTVDSSIPPEFSALGGYQYSTWLNGDGINLQLHPNNSYNILSKPFKITVIYNI